MKIRTRIIDPIARRAIVLLAQHIYPDGGGFLSRTNTWRNDLKKSSTGVLSWLAFGGQPIPVMYHTEDGDKYMSDYTPVGLEEFITQLLNPTAEDGKWTVDLNEEIQAVVRKDSVEIPGYFSGAGALKPQVIRDIGVSMGRIAKGGGRWKIHTKFSSSAEARAAILYAQSVISDGYGFLTRAGASGDSRQRVKDIAYGRIGETLQLDNHYDDKPGLYHGIADSNSRAVSVDEFLSTIAKVAGGGSGSPTSETVKLSNAYSAVITADKVTVGCQTFTKEAVQALLEAVQKTCK